MFYLTSDMDDPLISRSYETTDNVIPASNSIMANNLFYLGHYFDHEEYLMMSRAMLNNVKKKMYSYGSGYSNWGNLMMHYTFPFYEIVISGSDYKMRSVVLANYYISNKILLGAASKSDLPLFENRFTNKTLIYVCENKTCKMPVESVDEAVKQLK